MSKYFYSTLAVGVIVECVFSLEKNVENAIVY